jgi:hypothetical protein
MTSDRLATYVRLRQGHVWRMQSAGQGLGHANATLAYQAAVVDGASESAWLLAFLGGDAPGATCAVRSSCKAQSTMYSAL